MSSLKFGSALMSGAAAVAMVLASTGAHAAAQSSASISGLRFTLIDLSPDDGIAPSFSFLSSSGSTVLTYSVNDGAVGEGDSASRTRPGTFTLTQDSWATLTNAGVHAQVDNQSLAAGGYANGAQTSYNSAASVGYNPNTNVYTNATLSLSANSLLLIDADVSLMAAASNPQACGYYYYYCSPSETASATASANLSYQYSGSSVSSSYNATQTLSLQAAARGGYTDYTYVYNPATGYYQYTPIVYGGQEQDDKELHNVLHTVFSNSSELTQVARFGLSVSASGQATTAALIPEPSTYALFLEGLLAGGCLYARRRRQARQGR